MSGHPLEQVFRPRSIALYGVSRNLANRSNQFFRPEPHLVDDELGTRLYHSLSSSEHRREPRRR